MESETQTWRTEPRSVYSNDFKLRLIELATRPDANAADIARAHGVNDNVLFKWVRLCQREGWVSRHLPATGIQPAALPVEILPDPARQTASQNARGTITICSLTLRQ
ncbi:transposase [Kosakonia sp. S42]|uniref:transposase n=1 Tax=Kosakonia sp. S42 TaxID=2767458 RepID=UPI00190C43C6|nr:transposase [Kosakonia sp. S42]MBK0018889.1 transposase [Kosakonia sp. S42]